MRYKGKKIEAPTYEMVYEYCKKKGFDFDIPKFLIEMGKLGWCSPKTGKKYMLLENCICVYAAKEKRAEEKRARKVVKSQSEIDQGRQKLLWHSIVSCLNSKKGKRKYKGIEANEVWDYIKERGFRSESGEMVTKGKKAVSEYIKTFGQSKKPKSAKEPKVVASKSAWKDQYYSDLKDPRWKAFREFIFAVRGCKCEKCGNEYDGLVIHHGTCEKPVYHKKLDHPWEYNCNEVVVLCNQCHHELHNK